MERREYTSVLLLLLPDHLEHPSRVQWCFLTTAARRRGQNLGELYFAGKTVRVAESSPGPLRRRGACREDSPDMLKRFEMIRREESSELNFVSMHFEDAFRGAVNFLSQTAQLRSSSS